MIYQLENHIANQLKEFFNQFDFIDKVVVFGSRARHDCTPKSDIDLCIYSLEMTDIQFSKLKFEIDELPILYKLDVVHFEKVNKELQDNVERDGKLLFSKNVELSKVTDFINGYAFKSELFQEKGIPIIRIGNLENDNINLKNLVYYEKNEKFNSYIIKRNDILIAMSGATTGKIAYYNFDEIMYLNQRIGAIKIKEKLDSIYLFYFLKQNKDNLLSLATGSAQPNLSSKIINQIQIPLPTLTKQKKIANALDKASELITLRKESIKKLDELSKSIFIDMFGDPVLNPKKWKTIKLSKLGYCKNGLNYDSKENKYKIKCLGVGDFKNLTTIDDIESLQIISVDKQPSVEYLLQNKDLVFVRSNGNKELVGRCVEVYPNEEKVTFGGFCIRFRLSSDLVIVSYLLNVLKCKSMRQKMLGRGANIQNLNQQILNGLDIPLPLITLQTKFATIIEKIEEQKALYEKELKLLENNFDSLLDESFN